MAELGLAPTEDFASLKNDPVKYDRVRSYVKSQVYQSPAYSALEKGQTQPEFAQEQMGPYSKLTSEFVKEKTPQLRSNENLDVKQNAYETLAAGSYAAPTRLQEEVKKKGGYDINALEAEQDRAVQNYLNIRDQYFNGQIDRATYQKAISDLSVSARSLDQGQRGLREETDRAVGQYTANLERAKSDYEGSYKRFNDALALEKEGYSEARTEKKTAAEEMYSAAKAILDSVNQEQKEYQTAKGNIYNPNTEKYEAKPKPPGSGTPKADPMFAAADKLRDDLSKGTVDWGQAWNRLKAQFPNSKNQDIDAALGGSGGFDEATGQFDQSKATGFARQGARGEEGKNDTRQKAYNELDQDVSQWQADNPEGDPAQLYNLLLQYYGNDLNDGDIKAYLQSKGIYI